MYAIVKLNYKLVKKLALLSLIVAMVSCSNYKKNDNGISVYVKSPVENGAKLVVLEVVDEDIIHVQSSPENAVTSIESLMVDPEMEKKEVNWHVVEEGEEIILETALLRVAVNSTNGKVRFMDADSKPILSEAAGESAVFKPITLDGSNYYEIQQVFDSPKDEAFYGLGQHQNGEVNYKGKDVDLIQHNLVAVVPFLVSNKNYGILWDNYSHSKFGDPREYQQINSLTLYDENLEKGGLTVKYYSDREKKNLVVDRIEDTVYYKYLDQQSSYPVEFSPSKGLVEWNGYMESDQTGLYKFLIYSAGYLKVWIDDKLLDDTWRQTWNPWSRKYRIPMEAGKKVHVKLEWIPDGAESYVSMECLTPYKEEKQQQLSLYSEAGKSINYYFIKGNNQDDVVSGYRQVTGKSPIMPNWAMGLWQSRERYKTQEEILDVVKEYRKRRIPMDNIVLDWHYWKEDDWGDQSFDYERFPDPVAMNKELHEELNARIMISVWAKYYEITDNYKLMKDKGYLYMENINNRQKDWVGPGYVSTFYDAFNKDARDAFWSQLRDSLFAKNFDAWWLDATEPDILSNSSIEARKKLMTPSIGPSTVYMNGFSLQQSKGVYEGQREANPDQRVFILTRSAYAGQQRYAAATWSGDVVSRWSDLKEQIAAGVNISIAGIPYWTTDIGGFAVESRYSIPPVGNSPDLKEWRELNMRWFQFGVFCPLFRIHGQFPYREIFNVSPEGHPVYNSMVYYDKLRYRLMPYIYTMAGMTYHSDFTIMRPLVMDFGSDSNVLSINDQFMFGKALMVCPVYNYKASSRDVYMPAGKGWYDILSGDYFTGGKTYSIDAPLTKIPVFAPEGTILPLGAEIQYTDEKLADPITLYIYKGADGSFTLYEDEGTNYNYEKGSFSTINFNFINESNQLIISKRKGQFPGMLKERVFKVKLITPELKKGIDDDIVAKTINYKGEEISIDL